MRRGLSHRQRAPPAELSPRAFAVRSRPVRRRAVQPQMRAVLPMLPKVERQRQYARTVHLRREPHQALEESGPSLLTQRVPEHARGSSASLRRSDRGLARKRPRPRVRSERMRPVEHIRDRTGHRRQRIEPGQVHVSGVIRRGLDRHASIVGKPVKPSRRVGGSGSERKMLWITEAGQPEGELNRWTRSGNHRPRWIGSYRLDRRSDSGVSETWSPPGLHEPARSTGSAAQ